MNLKFMQDHIQKHMFQIRFARSGSPISQGENLLNWRKKHGSNLCCSPRLSEDAESGWKEYVYLCSASALASRRSRFHER